MRLLQSFIIFAGLACSTLIELPVRTSSFNSNPGLNTIHIATNYDPYNIANAATWNKYSKKGRALNCLLDMTDEQAGKQWPDPLGRVPTSASSEWKGTLEGKSPTLTTPEVYPYRGWFESEYDQDVSCNFGDNTPNIKNRIGVALTDLGLSATPIKDGGKNIGFSIEHNDDQLQDEDGDEVPIDEQFYYVDNEEYMNTGAYFRFTFNPEQGVIFGQNFLNPKVAAEDNGLELTKEELPKLSIASDILAAYWLRNPNPRNLKYWFGQDITNEETVPIIIKILVAHGYTEGIPVWPGLQLDVPSDEALALLGLPIGSTVAFFLIQHKQELELKHVSSITIFRDLNARPDLDAEAQLLFRIDDVPEDDVLPEDTEMLDEGTTGAHIRRSVKRKDSMVGLDLGRNISRMHEISLGKQGETVLYSHEFRREL
ncbi:hypothetical protein G6011_02847 [Alternaria panax]|uniref:Uncharacterized protein n=1 Tax=Alternaria panax TaxID=48097 RepID=A0AAD4FAZ8_9PLEO|nr:hypothetical protein G6011_02847 [Alternaria panax]